VHQLPVANSPVTARRAEADPLLRTGTHGCLVPNANATAGHELRRQRSHYWSSTGATSRAGESASPVNEQGSHLFAQRSRARRRLSSPSAVPGDRAKLMPAAGTRLLFQAGVAHPGFAGRRIPRRHGPGADQEVPVLLRRGRVAAPLPGQRVAAAPFPPRGSAVASIHRRTGRRCLMDVSPSWVASGCRTPARARRRRSRSRPASDDDVRPSGGWASLGLSISSDRRLSAEIRSPRMRRTSHEVWWETATGFFLHGRPSSPVYGRTCCPNAIRDSLIGPRVC